MFEYQNEEMPKSDFLVYSVLFGVIYLTSISYLDDQNFMSIRIRNLWTSNIFAITSAVQSSLYLMDYSSKSSIDAVVIYILLYAVGDLYDMRKIKYPGKTGQIVHHVMMIIMFLIRLLNLFGFIVLPTSYHYLVARNFLSEYTTPFLNYCFYCYYRDKKLENREVRQSFLLSSKLLAATYIPFRIINLLTLFIYTSSLVAGDQSQSLLTTNNLSKWSHFLLLIMNCVWWYKIVSKIHSFDTQQVNKNEHSLRQN
jgi:hypothetical protein